MELYRLTDEWNELFEQLEGYSEFEPDRNEQGEYIDNDGHLIVDVKSYVDQMKTALQTAWFTTLAAIEEMFEDKAVIIALFIKNLEAEIAAIKTEEARLKARRQAKEKIVKRLREYLLSNMQRVKLKKIDSDPRVKISLRANPPSVSIGDEKAFIDWAVKNHDDLLRYKDPEIDRTAVKTAIKEELDLPSDVQLVSTVSVIIK